MKSAVTSHKCYVMFRFDRSKSKNLFQLDAPEKDEEGFGISEVPRISLFGSEKNQKILQKNSKKIPIPEQRRPNGTENLDSSLKARIDQKRVPHGPTLTKPVTATPISKPIKPPSD